MNWTKDKPTAPGTWWWYREQGLMASRVVNVIGFIDQLIVIFDGESDALVDECDGEWAGPLEAPGDE